MSGEAGIPTAKGPWGPVATIGFTALIFAAFFLAQMGIAVVYLVVLTLASPRANMQVVAGRLDRDGFLLAVTEVVIGPLVIGLTILIAWLRKGPTIREYLALMPVGRRRILGWLLGIVAVGALFDVSAYLTNHRSVPEWELDTVRSAGSLPLLILALVLIAPVLEEVVFRGFLFEGLRHSRLGPAGAIVVAALVWAAVHLQYEWFYVVQVFVAGLLLGVARHRTGSLVPPMLMHALMNVTSTLQAVLETRS